MLWTKRTHQRRIFLTFEFFNENSPFFSSIFWNHKVRVYSNFVSLFSVIKGNSSVFFSSNLIYFGQKHLSKIFKTLSGWVKIHQIPHVMFEISSQFFFKLCIFLQCHERQLFCTFLDKTIHDLDKRIPSKCKVLDCSREI